jgi:transposase
MAKYKVTLTKTERMELEAILSKGYHTSHQFKNACILLNVDEGKYSSEPSVNREICKVLKIGMRTIDRVKGKFVEEGFDAVLERKTPDRDYDRKADGEVEAKLIALSCSKAPSGFSRWSLRLLADKVVELGYVESLSYETVRRVLKKTSLNRGK